jgi:hypothetical protein
MTEPCLHYAFNEAWIIHGDASLENADDATLRRSTATSIRDIREHRDHDATGRLRQVYHGGIGSDGRFLFHGPVTWYRADGTLQREATYVRGEINGRETCRAPDGSVALVRDHQADGTMVQTTNWPSGTVHTRSIWRDRHAHGPAIVCSPDGAEVYRAELDHGRVVSESGDPGEY